MAFDFHKDKQVYFNNQYTNSKEYIVPFTKDFWNSKPNARVLEIGSAEGGVLKAFTELGCTCYGVELMEERTELALQFMAKEVESKQVTFVSKNIYDINPAETFGGKFDLIILKDVIEHIFDQHKFIPKLHEFLNPGGAVFFGFPPWYMPFGGHQQICKNKLLSKLPYYHLLPAFLYKAILKAAGEKPAVVQELLEIKQTGISIERFERLVKQNDFKIHKRTFYLINPIYKQKFGLDAKVQYPFIASIPFIRNFFTTCMYYTITKK